LVGCGGQEEKGVGESRVRREEEDPRERALTGLPLLRGRGDVMDRWRRLWDWGRGVEGKGGACAAVWLCKRE